MEGQLTIFDYIECRKLDFEVKTCRIKLQGQQGGWTEVSVQQALEWARARYKALVGVREEIRTEYINDYLIQGMRFSEEELRRWM